MRFDAVVSCSKLKDTEWISRQDPYVCVEYGSTKFRTRTCTGPLRSIIPFRFLRSSLFIEYWLLHWPTVDFIPHSRRREKPRISREVHLSPDWRPSRAQCPRLEQQYSHLRWFYRHRKVTKLLISVFSFLNCVFFFAFFFHFALFIYYYSFSLDQDSIAQGSFSRFWWLCLATPNKNWQVNYVLIFHTIYLFYGLLLQISSQCSFLVCQQLLLLGHIII